MPQIGDHMFLIIIKVRYDFFKYKKGANHPKFGDDEIPCPSSSAERDFVRANRSRRYRWEAILN